MGKIVSNFFIALDGVVESPDQWHFPYFDDEMGRVIGQGMETNKALLMGRRLYEEWAAYWPHSDDEPFASIFNEMPKYVLSHRDFDATWNNTTVIFGANDAEVAEQVRALKATVEGDISMSGSATTARWLLSQGLIDDLVLLLHPIAVGQGQRLFEDTDPVPLQLRHSETLPTGVLHLRYAPAAPNGATDLTDRAEHATVAPAGG